MKIAMYDLEGHLLEVFEGKNLYQICKELSINQSALLQCLRGSCNTMKNRQFREVQDNMNALQRIGDVTNSTIGNKTNPVHKYYKGRYINTYQNIHKASLKTKVAESSIHLCCVDKRNTAGGFEWKYAV
jgi:hypothetical protein